MTASSRVVANGLASWDDVLIRAGYYTIPLAIICLWAASTDSNDDHSEDRELAGRRPARTAVLRVST